MSAYISKNSNIMAKTEIIPQTNELCRISKGTKISGVMTSSADIRIDGTFEGTVYTKGKLVIGEAANIKGKIFAQSCDVWGHVQGDIYIEDIINFKANSNFAGDLKTPKLSIEVGVIFNGSCHIITKVGDNKHLHGIPELNKAAAPQPAAEPAAAEQTAAAQEGHASSVYAGER